MATLLNFTNLKVTSRTIRLTCFDYDVIVVFVIWIMSEPGCRTGPEPDP